MRTFNEFLNQQPAPAPAVQLTQSGALSQWQWLEKRWEELPQEHRIHIIQYVRGILGDDKKD